MTRLVFRILVLRIRQMVLQLLVPRLLLFRSTDATEVSVIRVGLIT